jgi:nucleoid-associated protein YgaU
MIVNGTMNQISRYVLVVCIIVGGVLFARPYRKPGWDRKSPAIPQDKVVLHDPRPAKLGPDGEGLALGPIESTTPSVPPSSAKSRSTTAEGQFDGRAGQSPNRTEMSGQLPPADPTFPDSSPVNLYKAPPKHQPLADARAKSTATQSALPAKRKRRVKAHRIVDGDDLRSLAARYLGNPDRSLEIFELNRQVLARPDILPIGREILIPVERDRDRRTR